MHTQHKTFYEIYEASNIRDIYSGELYKKLEKLCEFNIFIKFPSDNTIILPPNKNSFCFGCERHADVGDLVLCSSCNYIVMGHNDMRAFFMNKNNEPTMVWSIKPTLEKSIICRSYDCSIDGCKCFTELCERRVVKYNFKKLPVRKDMMILLIILNTRMESDVKLPSDIIMVIMYI